MRIKNLGQFIVGIAIALSLAGCANTSSQPSAGDMIDDSVVTARVKTALLKDPKVSGLAVSVETFKGMVLLSGFVKTKAESDLAHKIAHDTPGVSGVVNSLQIR